MGEDVFRIRRSRWGEEGMRQHGVIMEDGTKLEYLTFPLLDGIPGVRHLFSTRLGGVSRGEFASMNLSFSRGDREADVLENYRRIAGVLGCSMEDMTASHQTHTTNIRHITPQDRGKGIVRERDYEDVDGLITQEPGIALVTSYADCVPLYFVDPVRRAIGLAHSGWRGTAARMGACMVRAMERNFHTKAEDLYAAVGPSICRDCYEVSQEVAEQFTELGEKVVLPGREPGKYQLDLWLANQRILEQTGIPKKQIAITDLCTCHNSSYLFSHRASGGKRGNLGAFLMLMPDRTLKKL